MSYCAKQRGFTLIELIVVIIIIGILSAIFIPSYWEVSRQARIATLDGVSAAMRSAVAITRVKALSQGLEIAPSNPGNGQQNYIVDVEGLSVEVDWRNLCPESIPEWGDALSDSTLSMLDYIQLTANPTGLDGDLKTEVDNQFTRVGYQFPSASKLGCFVEYDSFGDPMCTVRMVIDDC
ncbi:MAG: prepilin-type N-terminal cleavage/methylation domain-containing protein [Reinekea sp.]|nr:prepilin-type N-terminal cleavage/methylation domain-containing protein [Reinekea sp.]